MTRAQSLRFMSQHKVHIQKVLLGIGLLFSMSQIYIPLEPVPITLQPEALAIFGLLFERRVALQAVGAYLGLAALGVPVLAGFSGGILKFMGTNGGFLVGFYLSVWAMLAFRKYFNQDTFLWMSLNCLVGKLVLYSCGVAWLSYLIGFEGAIMHGVSPFIIPGLIKAAMLAGLVRLIRGDRAKPAPL
jgi:biotin transport system substrate-specific component